MSEENNHMEHETYFDCTLPDDLGEGEKHICNCGRIWRFDNGYFIMEGYND